MSPPDDPLLAGLNPVQAEAVTHTEGPLLLAALPPGRYEISASFPDVRPGAPTTVKRTVIVPRSGIAQTVLYFDTCYDVAQ